MRAMNLVRAGACLLVSGVVLVALASAAGVDRKAMDTTVAPGEDFWAYANGAFVKANPIPADRGTYGHGAMLAEQANKRTVDLIQDAARGAKPGSEAQKVGDYYATFMDEAAIEAKGITPLQPALDQIAAVADRVALAKLLGARLRADVDVMNATDLYTDNLFGLWVAASFDDPTRYVPFILQGGLGMPDRDYYLLNDAEMKKTRDAYAVHVAAMLSLAGVADSQAKAARVLALETKIAQAHASRVDTGDAAKGNNPWAKGDFAKKAPGMDWDAYFSAAALDAQKQFVVWQPSAVIGASKLVASESVDDWKIYLTFQTINHYASLLPKAFTEQRFAFYGKTLSGTPRISERWKRAINSTNAVLGEAVGKLYVAKYFPPEPKALLQTMVANEIAAFSKRIDAL